jgi:hypothetical protein
MILISAFLKIPFDHPLCTWDRIVIGSIVYTSCNILGCTKILFSSQCTPWYGVCYTLLECCPPSATTLWILTFFPAFLINKFVWFPEEFGVDLNIAQFRRCFVRLYNDGGVFQILLRAYWQQGVLNRFPAICVKDCHYHWLFWTFSIGDSKE